ncbi:hypothetical protein KUV28_06660 [Ferrimonas balearica]|nr:hypothetical protein [Ferrimonas balearica]
MEPLLVSLFGMMASGYVAEDSTLGKILGVEGEAEDGEEEIAEEQAPAEDGTSILDFAFPEDASSDDGGQEEQGEPADQAGSPDNQAATGEAAVTDPTLGQQAAGAEDAITADAVVDQMDDTVKFDVVTGLAGAAPALISGFDNASHDPSLKSDQVYLYDSEGNLIPENDFVAGDRILSIVDMEDGSGAALYLDDELVAVVEDYTADELAADTSWVGNFTGGEGEVVEITEPETTNIFADLDEDEAPAEAEASAATPEAEPEEDAAPEEQVEEAELAATEPPADAASAEEAPEEEATEAAAAEPTPEAEDNLASGAGEESLAGAAGEDTLDAAQDNPVAEAPAEATDETASEDTPEPTISLTVEGATASGNSVNQAMFGGNVMFGINSEGGALNDNIQDALDATDIENIRFPAGKGDGIAAEEGEKWLNIVDLDYDEEGNAALSQEVTELLDWARDPNGDGDLSDGKQVTLVIPTQHLSLEEYEEFGTDIEMFSQLVMEQYGDVVAGFEVGNEYWTTIGESEYGAKANIAVKALADGMEAAGVEAEDQPHIVVQMATPTGASDFHVSVADGSWIERLEGANEAIIAQLDEEARADLDGVVEHYYYRQDHDTYEDSLEEFNYIEKDYDVWDAAFDKELDLHITEWNIKTSNTAETGMKAASTMVEQFENMIEQGVDHADAWAVMHNTSTDLAGDRDGEVTTDDQGRVTTSINGATFDLMSSALPGKELLELDIPGDDGTIEVNAYADQDETVVYLSSRSLEVETIEIDLRELVGGDVEGATGVKIGIDQSTSNGWHWVSGEGRVDADFVEIDGEKYYYNEHDVGAELTDYAYDSSVITVTLKPYEVLQVTIPGSDLAAGAGEDDLAGSAGSDDLSAPDAGGVTAPDAATEAPVEEPVEEPAEPEAPEDTVSLDDHLVGSGYADYLKGFEGDDTIEGGRGDDTLAGSEGNDLLEGGAGEDLMNGGQQDDRLFGGSGDDEMLGWTGEDYLKGGHGHDVIDGGEGNDTLAGSQGNDTMYGGEGADEMNGGKDDDYISGGEGADTLTGWSGNDTFAFAEGDTAEGDVITDFQPAKDVIELDVPGLTSIADLVFTQREQGGVLIEIPGQGTVLLEGELTVADVAIDENFIFLAGAKTTATTTAAA